VRLRPQTFVPRPFSELPNNFLRFPTSRLGVFPSVPFGKKGEASRPLFFFRTSWYLFWTKVVLFFFAVANLRCHVFPSPPKTFLANKIISSSFRSFPCLVKKSSLESPFPTGRGVLHPFQDIKVPSKGGVFFPPLNKISVCCRSLATTQRGFPKGFLIFVPPFAVIMNEEILPSRILRGLPFTSNSFYLLL